MNCPNCGKLIEGDHIKFCPSCGCNLQIETVENPYGNGFATQTPYNTPNAPENKSKTPLIIAIVAIVLVVALTAGLMMSGLLSGLMKGFGGQKTSKTIFYQSKGDIHMISDVTAKKDKLNVKLQKMTTKDTAAMLSISEESRRMNDMMKMYQVQGMPMGDMPVDETLLLNTEHPLVKYLLDNEGNDEKKDTCTMISEQLYDLAKIQQSPLSADEMNAFIKRSNDILLKMAE